MDFKTAVQTCLSKYIDFNGRAQRSEYWWFFLFAVICSLIAGVIDGLIFGAQVVGLLVTLGLFLPGLAAVIRRLHDQDRVGWWALIALVPFIGGIALIVLMILKGTDGPNKYGPDPLADGYAPSNIPDV
ncbi:MAG: DUF805 domain-containing protein [Pseudomonadota bacterium]